VVNQLLSQQQKPMPRVTADDKALKPKRTKLSRDEQHAFRRKSAEPTQELLLDSARLDPHLVTFRDPLSLLRNSVRDLLVKYEKPPDAAMASSTVMGWLVTSRNVASSAA